MNTKLILSRKQKKQYQKDLAKKYIVVDNLTNNRKRKLTKMIFKHKNNLDDYNWFYNKNMVIIKGMKVILEVDYEGLLLWYNTNYPNNRDKLIICKQLLYEN